MTIIWSISYFKMRTKQRVANENLFPSDEHLRLCATRGFSVCKSYSTEIASTIVFHGLNRVVIWKRGISPGFQVYEMKVFETCFKRDKTRAFVHTLT